MIYNDNKYRETFTVYGKCITIFSAPNYCDSVGNKGGMIKFDHNLKPHFETVGTFMSLILPNLSMMLIMV